MEGFLLLHWFCHNWWFCDPSHILFSGLQQYNKNSPLISELDLGFIGSEIIDIEYYDSDWEHSHVAIIEGGGKEFSTTNHPHGRWH